MDEVACRPALRNPEASAMPHLFDGMTSARAGPGEQHCGALRTSHVPPIDTVFASREVGSCAVQTHQAEDRPSNGGCRWASCDARTGDRVVHAEGPEMEAYRDA